MKNFRSLAALALPVVLAAGCASGTAPKQAAPAATSPVEEAPEVDVFATTNAVSRPRLNNKMPKGFKRYNAPGVVNINKYLYPRRDYLGVYQEDISVLAGAKKFGERVGKQPNIVKGFRNWGDGDFDQAWAKSLWKAGAIPQLELEAWPQNYNGKISLKKIAQGKGDAYIRKLAKGIRASNVPVIFSFAHEFNANWYPWGAKATDFKAAWKRMHKIFKAEKATNAIWMWQPNQIHARPQYKVKNYFPGNAYVDWVGVVGYYLDKKWPHKFDAIFRSTFVEVRKFTKKPIIIPETGAIKGSRRAADTKDLLAAVAAYPNVIGFIWFNKDKRKTEGWSRDFRIQVSKPGMAAFKAGLKKGYFGR